MSLWQIQCNNRFNQNAARSKMAANTASSAGVTLYNGAVMPWIALGTWEAPPGQVGRAVEAALASGYRHLDCAHIYGNEREVGSALRASRIPREELFITTKIWNSFRTDQQVRRCCAKSLSDLGVDYLDLLLVHFPVGGRRALKECWQTMEALVTEGKCKAIGISNYYEDDVADLLSYARVKPACNQIELHPRLPQDALVEYCKRQGMVVTAYSPFGRGARGGMLDHAVVAAIAKKHGVAASSVLLGWSLARGVPALPKSVTPARIAQNNSEEVRGLALDADDVRALAGLEDGARFVAFFNHQSR